MLLKQTTCIAALLLGISSSRSEPRITDDLSRLPVTRLEELLEDIDTEMEQLAHYSLRGGVGPVGYRSMPHHESTTTEWIQVELDQETAIDQIVLVPSIWRDTKSGFRADGFPLEFNVIAGPAGDTNGTLLASFSPNDKLLPRIAPLIIPCSTTATWIRVEASELSPRAWDGLYNLQLAEILIFEGQENIALHQTIRTSSDGQSEGNSRKSRFLVDGFVPYLMDAAEGEQSTAYVSNIGIGDRPSLSIDLKESLPLNRIHLHTTDLSDTVPHSTPADFGIPGRLLIEGADRSDFSDAVLLTEYQKNSVFDVGPIIMKRFPETRCRYIRITAEDPYISVEPRGSGSQIGFAEIEVFSKGRNAALGCAVQTSFEASTPDFRSTASLVDGQNLYGQLLPIRDWMEELARRHDLETLRPEISTELNHRYARQKIILNRLSMVAVLLAAGIITIVLIDRMIRQRAIYRTRERIAADLHDELGANLHAIGLLGGIAESSIDDPDILKETVQRIRALTQRTGAATKLCTNMLEANGLCEDLVEEMKRASYRLLADLEHDITIHGEDILRDLKARKRIDLFLFYKECLTNIIRHSGATSVTTNLNASEKGILLTICDNGHGINGGADSIPSSLKRRARILGGKVEAEQQKDGGTCIYLRLSARWNLHLFHHKTGR